MLDLNCTRYDLDQYTREYYTDKYGITDFPVLNARAEMPAVQERVSYTYVEHKKRSIYCLYRKYHHTQDLGQKRTHLQVACR